MTEPPRWTLRRWLRSEDFRFPLAVFAFGRLAFLAYSYMAMTLMPSLYMHEADRWKALRPHPSIDGLCRWDCGWFERIAHHGYDTAENAKVFPLVGYVAGALEYATGLPAVAGIVLFSNVASFVSYFVIYALFRRMESAAAARWGLMLFVAYPFAYFQAAGYAESSMVLASSAALLLALNREHLVAGNVLGLGVMARHLTIFGGAGMLVAQLRQYSWNPLKVLTSRGVWGLALPFLYVAWFAFHLSRAVGDPLAFLHVRNMGWGRAVWWSARDVWREGNFETDPQYFMYQPFVLIPLLGTLLLFTRRKWMELAADSMVLMIVVLGSGGVALGRYSAACWPAFLPLGAWLSRRPALQGPILGALMLLQGMFFWLFTHQWKVL